MSHYQTYPEYKDSGVEWLGEVPAHWEIRKVRHIASLNPSLSTKVLSNIDAHYSFLPMECIGEDGSVDLRKEKKGEEVRNGYSYFEDGDVVYAKVTPCFENGKGAILQGLLHGAGFGTTEVTVIRPNHKIDPRFLDYTFRSTTFRSIGASEMTGAGGLKRVPDSFAKNFPIALPPNNECRLLCDALDRETNRLDALVAKKQRFIELLNERRKSLITRAVTKGLDPSVKMKDSGVEWLGEVPAHWKLTRITNLFSEASRPGQDGLPVLTISIHTGITGAELSDEERDRKVSLIEDRTKYQTVRPGDLAYNIMRAWQGGFGFVKVEGLVSPAYVVAEPKVEMVGEYFEMVLRTPMAVTEMWRFSRGIADFRMRLYWDYFKNIVVPVPPCEEQRKIVDEVQKETDRTNSLIKKTQRSIDLLKERRAALITAAVTGKIDLREEPSTEVA